MINIYLTHFYRTIQFKRRNRLKYKDELVIIGLPFLYFVTTLCIIKTISPENHSSFIVNLEFWGNSEKWHVCSNAPKDLRTKFLKNDGLLCFTGISMFGSLKSPFAIITSKSELYFRFRRCILLVKAKKKKDFYELWQQHKQLKTMEMKEA